MANIYVRSTDGSDADNGTTWALAKATLAGAAAIDAAGDTVYVSQDHAETGTGPTLNFAGTIASPTRIVCGNDAAEPPTAVATTASVTITGAGQSIQFVGKLYVYGMNFINNGSGNAGFWFSNGVNERQLWEKCSFQVNSASASSIFINAASTTTGDISWKDCTVKFGAAGSTISTQANRFRWDGGSVVSGGTTPTALFNMANIRYSTVEVSGVDFSNFGTGFYFLVTNSCGKLMVRNCKLPGSWTGGLHNGTMAQSARAEMYNCDSGDTNYRIWVKDFAGDMRDETTLVKTGGASAAGTAISWKIATTANCNWTIGRFETPPISRWNSTVGSAITVTVDFLRDSVTNLTDDDVWLEVQYLGTSGVPLSLFVADVAADILAAPTAQPASSATWTTTGMTNPNKQYASVTFTPQEVGYIQAKIICGIASTTIYVDPKLQVS